MEAAYHGIKKWSKEQDLCGSAGNSGGALLYMV
jgi:hypothetical protein